MRVHPICQTFRFAQRLDLFSPTGERLGGIEYQLEDVGTLIHRVHRATTRHRRTDAPRTTLGKRWTVDRGIVLLSITGVLALGVWTMPAGQWIGSLLIPLMSWALYAYLRDDLRAIELRPTELVLRTTLRERRISREAIADVRLALKPAGHNQYLCVIVELNDGATMWIRPPGEKAQDVHAAIRAWLHPGSSS